MEIVLYFLLYVEFLLASNLDKVCNDARLSIPFIHSSENLITSNSNRFRLKMQAFYVKKEKKLPNVYHKSKAGNQSYFHDNMKDNEIKPF